MQKVGLRRGVRSPVAVLVAEAATPATSMTVMQVVGQEGTFLCDITPPMHDGIFRQAGLLGVP